MLKRQFLSVFSKEDPTGCLPEFRKRKAEVLNNFIKKETIAQTNLQKNPYKSQGADGINPFFMKQCAIGMPVPLSLIYCKSLEDGEIPDA